MSEIASDHEIERSENGNNIDMRSSLMTFFSQRVTRSALFLTDFELWSFVSQNLEFSSVFLRPVCEKVFLLVLLGIRKKKWYTAILPVMWVTSFHRPS